MPNRQQTPSPRWMIPWLAGSLLLALAAEPAAAQKQARPSSRLHINQATVGVTEGDGYMVGGELWETIKPMNTSTPNGVEDPLAERGFLHWLTIGPDGSEWREPVGLWPGGYIYTDHWRDGRRMLFPCFESEGWPGYGADNPIRAGGGDNTEDDRFMFAYYTPDLQGVDDPSRTYKRPARFTDRTRTHLVYEAGWPTTTGIDFKVKAHQYTINEQNLNDFVVLEITLTNTGVVDTDGDGTPEATGHAVDAVTAGLWMIPTITVGIDRQGTRRTNYFGAGRSYGYVGTPDTSGAPYNLAVSYANVPPNRTENQRTPPPGQRLIGVNEARSLTGYTDVWNGWSWMGVKQGSVETGVDGSSPDKQTLFGTHPIGEGPQRGWYTSMHWNRPLSGGPLGGGNRSDNAFRSNTATWYEDYGKTTTSENPPDLEPNPAFFSGGTPDDVTTFTVGTPSARPNGDYKYASEDLGTSEGIQQPIWETAWNPAAANEDFYNGTGFVREFPFGENMKQGIGPFSLDVGESITMTLALTAGFRFEGVAGAAQAARWAWNKGWDVSDEMPAPPAPDVSVESTENLSTRVRWTDVSSIDADVDGYKVWRAAQYKRTAWLEKGFRALDRYQHQHEVDADVSAFLDPVNPFFDVSEGTFSGETQGVYQPAEWGSYDLLAKIPAAELDQYQTPDDAYDFAYEDQDAVAGFTYWYYVSAYKEGTFSGPQGDVPVGHIESSNFNRNGRNGFEAAAGEISLASPWFGTYPFADLSPDFPALGAAGYDNTGAEFTLTPPTSSVDEAAELITVTPNPYKRTALNDVRSDPSDHNVNFLNMPEEYTLTIVDVTGQIVFQTNETDPNAQQGRLTWEMYSKDGVEVASGLYVYHVEYGDGRSVTGHLAILR